TGKHQGYYNQAFAGRAGQTVVSIGFNFYNAKADGQDVVCSLTSRCCELTLTVVKDVVSTVTPENGKFNLLIDGATKAADAVDGGTAGPTAVTAGNHTFGESPGTATSMADYNQAFACLDVQAEVTIGYNNT